MTHHRFVLSSIYQPGPYVVGDYARELILRVFPTAVFRLAGLSPLNLRGRAPSFLLANRLYGRAITALAMLTIIVSSEVDLRNYLAELTPPSQGNLRSPLSVYPPWVSADFSDVFVGFVSPTQTVPIFRQKNLAYLGIPGYSKP